MDRDNFRFDIHGFHVLMAGGQLEINSVTYEDNEDDPTYAFARWIAAAMGLI